MGKLQEDIKSTNKQIQQGQNRDFFFIYSEEHGLLKESLDTLVNLMRTTENPKLQFEIAKYISEQIIGKANVTTDITSNGEKIHTVLLDIFQDDKNNKETE